MPRWIGRVIWALRGKRLARIHLHDNAPSAEGILVGRWGGHYVLLTPKLLEAEGRTYSLDGHLEIPAERVLYVQVLG